MVTAFAQRLARILADRSDLLFGLPGGGPNLDLVGAATTAGMRFVLAHGETSAAIMASTYGLLTGGPTGVVVTRGPGAASLINGAAQATLDRYPLVVVTDTVAGVQSDRISHQRIDQRAMFAPVTVASMTATEEADLDSVIDRAGQWPPGAVHLDVDPTAASAIEPHYQPPAPPSVAERIDEAMDRLVDSQRPLVLVGMEAAWMDHQARLVDDLPPIRGMLEELGCPLLTTYQAIGLVPTEGPLNAGLFTNGALERPALDQADLIITVGLDTVEPIPAPWSGSAPVISISSTPAIDAYVPTEIELVGDVATIGHQLISGAHHRQWAQRWPIDSATKLREEARRRLRPPTTDPDSAPPPSSMGPVALVDALLASIDPAAMTVTVDAGAHFLAVMPHWPVQEPFDLLISNGLATMGFALPAAIGAALARPDRPVLALIGDGGLSMTMAELETIARLELPVTVVVFNDSALSLIAIKQREDHGGPTAIRYRPIDFATIAEASGLDGVVANTADEVMRLVQAGGQTQRLIDARIDPADYRHLIEITRG